MVIHITNMEIFRSKYYFYLQSIYAFCTNYAEKQTKDIVTLWRQAVDNPFAFVCKILYIIIIYAMYFTLSE
jgi:hypothetical protein